MKECKNLTSEVKSQKAVYYVMWKQTCGTCKGEAVWAVYRHVSALLAVSVVVAVADSKLSLLGRAELKKIGPPSLPLRCPGALNPGPGGCKGPGSRKNHNARLRSCAAVATWDFLHVSAESLTGSLCTPPAFHMPESGSVKHET